MITEKNVIPIDRTNQNKPIKIAYEKIFYAYRSGGHDSLNVCRDCYLFMGI